MARIAQKKKEIFIENARKTLETAISEKAYIREGSNYYIDFRNKKIIDCNLFAFDYGVLFDRSLTSQTNRALQEIMSGRKSIDQAMEIVKMMIYSH